MSAAKRASLTVQEAKSILREAELRGTAARIAVLQCLEREAAPQSHADVTERLEGFGFDPSTIYRSLTELSEAGLLARLDLGDGTRRFELLKNADGSIVGHPHFMCVDCGKIQCLDGFTFVLSPTKRGASQPGTITEVLVKGHCAECQ